MENGVRSTAYEYGVPCPAQYYVYGVWSTEYEYGVRCCPTYKDVQHTNSLTQPANAAEADEQMGRWADGPMGPWGLHTEGLNDAENENDYGVRST